jgi:hypothetical protein
MTGLTFTRHEEIAWRGGRTTQMLPPVPDLSHLSEPCVFASRHSFPEAQGVRGD